MNLARLLISHWFMSAHELVVRQLLETLSTMFELDRALAQAHQVAGRVIASRPRTPIEEALEARRPFEEARRALGF